MIKCVRFFLAVSVSFLIPKAGFSQIKFEGDVVDFTGRAISYASVSIVGSYDGGTTDTMGHFEFKTAKNIRGIIEVTASGFETYHEAISGNLLQYLYRIHLKQKITTLNAVTVIAGTFETGEKSRSATVLSSLDILTTANSNGDISGAIKTLPGVQVSGDKEGLFVRGGDGNETKQFIDGLVVANPYYSSVPGIAQRGRFSPTLFKGTIFSSGGYSALYGDALSAVLIMESVDLPEKSQTSISFSPIFLNAESQIVNKNKKYSWGLGLGYTNPSLYYRLLIPTVNFAKSPAYETADANFRIKTSGGIIKFYGTYSTNNLGLRTGNIDSSALSTLFLLNNINVYNNLTWKEYLNNNWKISIGGGYTYNRDILANQVQNTKLLPAVTGINYIDSLNFRSNLSSNLYQARVVVEKTFGGVNAVRFGGENFNSTIQGNFINTIKNYQIKLTDNFTALFVESDYHITAGLASKIGLRLERSSLLNKNNLAPRISLAYKVENDAQISIAYGVFFQRPQNNQLYYETRLEYTKATHYILNYQKKTPGTTFRVEAFYKQYQGLIKTFPIINNAGYGYAKGAEIFYRDSKTVKGFDYWISYSLLDTKRSDLLSPVLLTPNYAAKHTASLVVKRIIPSIKSGISATYTYASGRPYYFMTPNLIKSAEEVIDHGTTISYNSIGLSAYYLPHLGETTGRTSITFVASITNILNTNPVFDYNFSHNGIRKSPITLPSRQMVFIGCFFSFGVDKSQNVINDF